MNSEELVRLQGAKGGAEGLPAFAAGVADGDECRRQGGTPSKFRLVAINDDYSAGFRAGYFQRGLDNQIGDGQQNERNRDAMVGL